MGDCLVILCKWFCNLIVSLIIGLIIGQTKLKFHVTDATLTDFNFSTTSNTLYYDLAVNMTISNPSKRVGINYKRIEARAYYLNHRFDAVTMKPFYQGHKKNNTLSPVFKGQKMVMLGSSELSQYKWDKSCGIYNIEVTFYLQIKYKMGVIEPSYTFDLQIKCGLKVPLLSNATMSATTTTFETTKCTGW